MMLDFVDEHYCNRWGLETSERNCSNINQMASDSFCDKQRASPPKIACKCSINATILFLELIF